jgi:uncharacterized protein (TIGR03437 family)
MKSLQIVIGLLMAAGTIAAQQYNISTIAGIGTVQGYFGDGGPATNGQLDYPFRITIDSKGNYFIADYYTNVVREVAGPGTSAAGTIITLAGNTTFGFQGDGGPGFQAELSDVHGLATDSKGNLYIADTFNGRVRKVTPVGSFTLPTTTNVPTDVISTFAGNGTHGYTGDGAAAANAELSQPSAVAVDSSGNVYIADFGNYTVRKVDTSGNITTIAGTGVPGYSGDGGPANKAQLAQPYALAIDASNNIYISDLGNTNIREITTDGNIRTLVSGISTDSIAIDTAGSIYFVDSFTHTVRKILPGGTQFIIAGIPGNPGFSGDGGPGTSAQLNQPHGVALDSSGNVYVADSGNDVIRLLTPVASSISLESAASGNGVSISPGEIVNIFGTGLGPATPVSAAPVNGFYPKQLAGTTVTFNGVPAVVFYTSATQVSAIVPYSMPIGAAALFTVSYQGQSYTTADALPIAAAAPGIFTANSSGIGQVAAINQNNTINSTSAPAPEGTIVSLYVTGEGLTSPAGVDGRITTNPFPTPVMGVSVTMNGQNVPVTYAGEAPGLVAGVMQVNALIPSNLLSEFTTLPVAVPVVVTVGVISSQANATISVVQ